MSKYTGVVISDIHIGIKNTPLLHEELKNIFIGTLNDMDKLDFIIIAGDYFDKKLYANEEAIDTALYIMSEIIEVCKKFNAKLRIVYGTESHESNQYILFNHITKDIDYKMIKTVQEEYLFEDLKVLYVPEEYIEDKSEYYSKYFDKKEEYDYVFGHGNIVNLMKGIKPLKTEEDFKQLKQDIYLKRTSPFFNPSELAYCCKGQVYFGHYHINIWMDNKIFYCGSFSRWCFGEDKDKGFYIINCNTSKGKYTNKFIVNTMAEVYKTIEYDQKELKDSDNIVKVFEKIVDITNKELYPHLKVKLDIPEDMGLNTFVTGLVRDNYSINDKTVRFDYDKGYVTKEKKEQDRAFKEEYERFSYILDKSLSMPEKIHTYINLEFNANMELDEVKKCLYNDLKEEVEKIKKKAKKATKNM